MDSQFAAMLGKDLDQIVNGEFGSKITYVPGKGEPYEVQAVHQDQGLDENLEADGRQEVLTAHLLVRRLGDHAVTHPYVNDAWYHEGRRYHVIGFEARNEERAVLVGVHSVQSTKDRPDLRRTRR